MGLLRLMLALAVVVEHAPDEFRIKLVPGDMAVEMFFMISGFYMALILSTRYETKTPAGIGAFYLARYLRLWPAYAVTAAILYAWLALIFIYTGHPATGPFDAPPQSSVWQGVLAFSNLTMIGQDALTLFHVTPHGEVVLTFGPPDKLADGSQTLGYARIVGQAWSIGTEIWFYLMVPFLIRFRLLSLMAVGATSFALRYVLGERFGLTTYFFFPAQLGLFIAGMLAYRWRKKMWSENGMFAIVGLVVLVAAIVVFQYIFPQPRTFKWGLYFLLFIFMPAIFEKFRTNAVDRLIGELSYPIYITHRGIISIFGMIYLKLTGALPPGFVLLLLVVGVSSLLFFAVESPVDRFRHQLLRSKMHPDSQVSDLAAPLLSVPPGLKEP